MRIHRTAAAFAGAAAEYERGRPDYPDAAVEWLAQRLGLRPERTVLDLAAGTGKLTRQLIATGARVVAVEPIDAMREQLARAVPQVAALAGTAEAIPLADGSVDAVTVAQAFHWFEPDRALPELHRVLHPGGSLALVWNTRDLDHPLHAEIERVLEPLRRELPAHTKRDQRQDFADSPLFSPVEERQFAYEQRLSRDTLVDRFASESFVAALPDRQRQLVIQQFRDLAVSAPEPIVLPYVTLVFVSDRR